VLDTYWGVRPLYDSGARPADRGDEAHGTDDSRSVSRGFHLLDHADRDDLPSSTEVGSAPASSPRVGSRLSRRIFNNPPYLTNDYCE
jgi:glycerol-3-phosphate dehydrogenase